MLVFIASGKSFKRLNVKNAESEAFKILETKKCFIFMLHAFKYGETWQITEKLPNPKIAEITGNETVLEHTLQPLETSIIALRKSDVFSPKLKVNIISERHENVSTHAEIFIIALAPDATEFINTFSLFSGVIVLFFFIRAFLFLFLDFDKKHYTYLLYKLR